MPKSLSNIQIKNIKKLGNHRVGDRLYISVEKTRKQWYIRPTIDGKRSWIYIGSYPAISPTEAKQKAIELLTAKVAPQEILRKAKDEKASSAAKEAAKGMTFQEVTEEFIENVKRPGWTNNGRSEQGWRNTLNQYILPVIGHLEVEAITPQHLVQILSPLWMTKNVTATRSQGRVYNIIDYAISHDYSEKRNPAKFKGLLENLLPKYKGKPRHHPACQITELPALTGELWEKKEASHSALKLIMLTQTRSEDARGALWTQFDLQNGTWWCPIGKLGGEVHKIPIPKRLLWSLQERADFAKDERMFPGDGDNKFLTSNAVVKVMRSFKYLDYKGDKITLHGFRSTFTDWTLETEAGDVKDVDRQLAHREEDQVLAAYWRSALYDRRVRILQEYEDYAFSDMASSIH